LKHVNTFDRTSNGVSQRQHVIIFNQMAPVFGDKATLTRWAQGFGVESSDVLHYYRIAHRFHGFSAWLNEKSVDMIRSEPLTAYVEEDELVSLNFTTLPYQVQPGLLGAATRVPYNPAWQSRRDWGQQRSNSRVWNLQTSPSDLYSRDVNRYADPYATNWNWTTDFHYQTPSKGERAIVWVVDTGVRATHLEFTTNANGATVPTRVTQVLNFVSTDNQTADGNGHGTHCAGTIGGTFRGVAPDAEIRSIRVLNNGGSGSWADVIAGFNYVANYNIAHPPNEGGKVNILSASLGGGGFLAVDQAATATVEAGVHAVIAAGNSNNNACQVEGLPNSGNSPARAALVIPVSALESSDTIASFSSYGPCVKSNAPGVNVASAWIPTGTGTDNDWYNNISGTSMATPHVAGAIALYVSEPGNPVDPDSVKAALATDQTNGAVKGLTGVKATTPNVLLYTQWKLNSN